MTGEAREKRVKQESLGPLTPSAARWIMEVVEVQQSQCLYGYSPLLLL